MRRGPCEGRTWGEEIVKWGFCCAFHIFFFPPTTNCAATQHFTALLEQIYKNALADSSLQNVLSALNFTNYNSTASVRATWSLWSVWCWILSDGTRGWSGRRVCCRFGRTVWSIYMCSSTLIYLLFTKSIHTVHPQISMIQLVAPSQTVSEMDRERKVRGLDIQDQCVLSRGGNRKSGS